MRGIRKMAGTEIIIREEGFSKLEKSMKKMVKFIKKPRKAYAGTVIVMFKDVQDHFIEAQGPSGPWEPLKYREGLPLSKTARLKNSITRSYDDKDAIVGTNVVYGATHNFGRGAIPERPFMWLSKKKDDTIRKIFIKQMDKLLPSF